MTVTAWSILAALLSGCASLVDETDPTRPETGGNVDSEGDGDPGDSADPDSGADTGYTECGADDPYLFTDGSDDAEDDREAIQSRLDADGAVHLGPGEWRVSLDTSRFDGPWAIPLQLGSGARLVGCDGATLRPMPDASHWIVLVRQVDDVEIRGLAFEADPPDVGQQAILIDGASNVRVKGNTFRGFSNDVMIGGWPTMPDGSAIPTQECDYLGTGSIPDEAEGTDADFVTVAASEIEVADNTFDGTYNPDITNTADVFLTGGVASASVHDNSMRGGEWFGIAMMPNMSGTCREDITGVYLRGNTVSGARAYGILGYQSYEDPEAIHEVTIAENRVDTVYGDVLEGSAGAGIYLPGPVRVTVSENTLRDTSLFTDNATHNAAAIGGRMVDSSIVGNTISRFGYYGIDVSGVDGAPEDSLVTIEGNILDGTECPRTDGAVCHDGIFVRSPGVDVRDNDVTFNRQGAITVMDSSGRVTVTGNSIETTASRAIRVLNARDVELDDNDVVVRAAGDGETGEEAPCETVTVYQAADVRISGGTLSQEGIDYAIYGGYGPVLYANNAALSAEAVEAISPSTWSVALVASCDDTGCGTPDEDGECALGCVAQAGACVRECEPISIDAATAPTCAEVYVASGLSPTPSIEACD